MVKFYTNKQWLTQQYINEDKTVEEIADLCGCSHQTIYRYLKKFDLIRNPRSW